MFASRVQPGPGRNRLSLVLEQRRRAGLPVLDLTESNPTRAGFAYPPALLAPLSQPDSLRYHPHPLGIPPAREAVSDDFRRRGVETPANRIALTASTSEAYSVLFKLLCDPGDAVLVPRPSYPLIQHLTDLDGVVAEPYELEFHGRWSIDLESIERMLQRKPERIRAIILVSPNNPTGSVVTPTELARLAALAARHDVALIADEVFADYPIQNSRVTSASSQAEALTFALGGLSKTVGLPQVKLAWIGATGPQAVVIDALDRLETICDTYLSVSTPVQVAARRLLCDGAVVREQIHNRVRANAAVLQNVVASHPACGVLPIEAGWYAVLRIPAVKSEEQVAVELLERDGVLVHPGYFFDFAHEAFLILSLLPAEAVFASGLSTLLARIDSAS